MGPAPHPSGLLGRHNDLTVGYMEHCNTVSPLDAMFPPGNYCCTLRGMLDLLCQQDTSRTRHSLLMRQEMSCVGGLVVVVVAKQGRGRQID